MLYISRSKFNQDMVIQQILNNIVTKIVAKCNITPPGDHYFLVESKLTVIIVCIIDYMPQPKQQ